MKRLTGVDGCQKKISVRMGGQFPGSIVCDTLNAAAFPAKRAQDHPRLTFFIRMQAAF
jgi:hypothetical protein